MKEDLKKNQSKSYLRLQDEGSSGKKRIEIVPASSPPSNGPTKCTVYKGSIKKEMGAMIMTYI